MKRRHIIVLLLACAVLALILVVWGNWKIVAYVKIEEETHFDIYAKRWWLPSGPDIWATDQVCPGCRSDDYSRELEATYSGSSHTHENDEGKLLTAYMRLYGAHVPFDPEGEEFAEFFLTLLTESVPRCICQQCFPGRTAR